MSEDIRNEGMWEEINKNRDFMKCPDFMSVTRRSDQEKELPQPPIHEASKGDIIALSADFNDAVLQDSYLTLLDARRSERVYDKNAVLTQNQLAFLLWSTQGIQEIRGKNYAALRPAPSGGARHPFETYILARSVEGLTPGLYRYLPLENVGTKHVAIEFISEFPDYDERVTNMLAGQKWACDASAIIFYSCIAYRAEWRYCNFAHRVALIDLGHVGQNFMLTATAMGLGSCCMAAYDQKLCDKALSLDGNEEYTVYACSIGKTK